MKNTFGNSITVTLFGESHGEAVGVVIDGLAPGIKIDREYILRKLAQRRPFGRCSTARVERDEYTIVSGVFNEHTTGTPLTILIPNENKRSGDYSALKNTPRPGHADYTAECKYHGYQDYRGGGHFSGRVTAALVAAGSVLAAALEDKGIKIGTHIASLHGIEDRAFRNYDEDIEILENKSFPALSAEDEMLAEIERARSCGDSVGGILESIISGVPAGVGEPWFDSVEGCISHILFSIGGIKGVEFGEGFGFASLYGSEANDPIKTDGNIIYTETNKNGGINGGITNGMPIIVRSAVKPTPSIYKTQSSVDLSKKENTELKIEGRHDPAIIHRARAVVDAALAIATADLLAMHFGTDHLAN